MPPAPSSSALRAPSEPPPSIALHCEQAHARARDGAAIPITLVRAASTVPTAETPLHCVVYGAYGAPIDGKVLVDDKADASKRLRDILAAGGVPAVVGAAGLAT